MLERYNPEICTFFIPVGEMGLTLNEKYEVSGLMMGDIPYEEYIPSIEELYLMEDSAPLVYTYWEVLCHFHICAEITSWRAEGIKQWLGQITSSMIWGTRLTD